MARKNTIGRIMRNCEVDPVKGCHLWKGRLDRDGYGLCSYRGKTHRVHRLVWIHYKGPIPEGFEIDHKCDTRRCRNLDHLQCIPKLQNLARAGKFKLSDDEVELIKMSSLSNSEIAAALEVDPSLVSKIRGGKHR